MSWNSPHLEVNLPASLLGRHQNEANRPAGRAGIGCHLWLWLWL